MAEDLQWHLETNAALWRRWEKHGIKPGQEFAVDFNFYCPRRDIADAFVRSLEDAGFAVKKETKRTLLFWRGWEIEATATFAWTPDYLNERTKEFCKTANECGFSFEGIGALMPAGS
jgi:hypothetical protein